MAVLTEKPASWASFQRVLPSGYRAIKNSEALADPAILKAARTFIDKQVKLSAPLGTREFKVINGKQLLFTVEPHYHEPNGPTKPWGWHKGASVSINPTPAPAPAPSKGWWFWSKPAAPAPAPTGYTMHGDAFEGERLNHFKAAVAEFFKRKVQSAKHFIKP